MQKDLKIENTKTTPGVDFSYESGKCLIQGESYPEDSFEFFNPLRAWIKERINEKKPLELSFRMIYFNTSSSKAIMDILDDLQEYYKNGGNVKVNWYFEKGDEDIEVTGKEMFMDITLPYEIKSF